MSQYTLHKAETRGHDHLDWLDSRKTFSFADYYNPKRMGFGALRVLNDDTLAGGRGFGTHPHDNMEIISIPLEGALRHEDSAGNKGVVAAGQIQVMHAGSGLFHSEYNNSEDQTAKFLQIWVFPEELNTAPRYIQANLPVTSQENTLYEFIAPGNLAIRKDTWFSKGTFTKDAQLEYQVHREGNGVYAFVINGNFGIDGQMLSTRDGLGIQDTMQITIRSLEQGATLLLMEVPMNIQ
ncbi:MAG TPA: pirin family protein [Chitinophaga sp.]|uniref:pirin family protein n=1 Tax=Chitinophaga sp. TaxID=1869181 RepID=UPI002C5451D4|nr:pirin family protein [Chitinophaga sp.]HVI47322.1 pirin family protein [Chitinophaga sp.]